MELFPDAAKSARSVFDEVEVGNVEVSEFNYKESRFDLILALDVLEHLVDPWTTLTRLREKLSPDGVLLASVPNVSNYKVSAGLLFHGAWDYTDGGLLDRTHLRFFTKKTAVSLFESTGYRVDKVLANDSYPNFLSFLGMSDSRGRWYSQKLLRSLPILPSRLFEYQYLIVAKAS